MYTFSILDGRQTTNPNGGLSTGGIGTGGLGGIDFGGGIFGTGGIGGSIPTTTTDTNAKEKVNVLDVITKGGNTASKLICAFKGGCQTNTTILQPQSSDSEKKKGSTTMIVLSLIIGLPILFFLGLFFFKLLKGGKK